MKKYKFSEAVSIEFGESDAKDPLTRKAVFVREGLTKNKQRFYTKAALRDGAEKFVGAKMYLNHQDANEATTRPERSVEDDIAVIKKAYYETGADGKAQVTGEFSIYGSPVVEAEAIAKWIDMKKRAEAGVELSLHGFLQAENGEANGQVVNHITKIDSIDSVDFVTRGNAFGVVSEAFTEVEDEEDDEDEEDNEDEEDDEDEEDSSRLAKLKAELKAETDPDKKAEIQSQIDAIMAEDEDEDEDEDEEEEEYESFFVNGITAASIMAYESATGKEYHEGGPGSGRRPEGGSKTEYERKNLGKGYDAKQMSDFAKAHGVTQAQVATFKAVTPEKDGSGFVVTDYNGTNYMVASNDKAMLKQIASRSWKAMEQDMVKHPFINKKESVTASEVLRHETETGEEWEGGPGSGRRPEGGNSDYKKRVERVYRTNRKARYVEDNKRIYKNRAEAMKAAQEQINSEIEKQTILDADKAIKAQQLTPEQKQIKDGIDAKLERIKKMYATVQKKDVEHEDRFPNRIVQPIKIERKYDRISKLENGIRKTAKKAKIKLPSDYFNY